MYVELQVMSLILCMLNVAVYYKLHVCATHLDHAGIPRLHPYGVGLRAYNKQSDPYHKGAIAPLYIGIVVVWPASLPYIWKIRVSVAIGTQSGIRLNKRVPMVKIWGSSKNDQNWTTGKLLKL